ncbi:ABC transporter permease [uncultured Desulfobacter sp.]|uniref:ABC transporter permease n=1 Tax=uncultured Desulfobacter sp. TaxID=240139 RepID=UPI0029F46518|nr:ABC transporter permease [uncultured Desulfobacter sp.]
MNRFLMRLFGVLRKETLQILRDPSSIILALVMPLALLIIFGYGVSLDAEHVPMVLVNQDNGSMSRELAVRFAGSANFKITTAESMAQAQALVLAHKAEGIIFIQNNFTAIVEGADSGGNTGHRAPVQLIINGTDANRARLIEGYMKTIGGKWASVRVGRGQTAAVPPVSISQRIWFNEAAISRYFLIPGLIVLIMTLIGILLTALVIAREWERGTMEAMLVTPLRKIDILLGKTLPYYFLGMLGMSLSVVVGTTLFGVPFRGSVGALVGLSSLFMLTCLGFGLFLSAAIRIQFVAAQTSIMAGYLPAFFLSGLIFDLESTPKFIQVVSYLFPARYFVTIAHTLFAAGDVWYVLLPNALVLAFMALLFLGLAFRKMSKRLE